MTRDRTEAHYNVDGLGETILAALAAAGKNIDALGVDDLAPVDEFHVRGRRATEDLARAARIRPEHEVLDVGCGLGGTARYLAAHVGCKVFGVDLTAEYCRVAEMLSARVGLAERTSFRQANATALPFEDQRFDVVWTEHVQMNVPDKAAFYRELRRVLKPAGLLAFHDIFAGPHDGLHYPVPWAAEASISHLISVDDVKVLLADAGWKALQWDDVSEVSTTFFQAVVEHIETSGWMPVGLHLLMGDSAVVKFSNMRRNLEEGRVRVVQALMTPTVDAAA